MKKIIIGLLFIFSIFFVYLLPVNATEKCIYDKTDIGKSINNCLNGTSLVPGKDVKIIEGFKNKEGFKNRVLKWVKNISIFLSIMAVGSIVYGAFMLTISAGEDERIKKGKDIVKWGMIGFLVIISAGGLIAIVINFVYKVAG